MKTLQQSMAVSALEQVSAFKKSSSSDAHDKYRTMALKLPILILTDGLVQALAFVQARGDDAQTRLLNDVAQTVSWNGANSGTALVTLSRTADLGEYMVLTRRVLAALTWYKRYAESVLSQPAENSGDSEQAGQEGQTAVPAEGGGNA